MELDAKAAVEALKTWRAILPKDLTDAEFGPPGWAFAEVCPVLAYRVRGCICYVYAFMGRRAGTSGFVLNADWHTAQLIHGGSKEALAAALSIATMRPATRDRKEV